MPFVLKFSQQHRQLFTCKQKQLAATCWQKKKQKPSCLTSKGNMGSFPDFQQYGTDCEGGDSWHSLILSSVALNLAKERTLLGIMAKGCLCCSVIKTYFQRSILFIWLAAWIFFISLRSLKKVGSGVASCDWGQEVPPAWAEPSGSCQLLSKCIEGGSPSVCPPPPPPLWNINAVEMNF